MNKLSKLAAGSLFAALILPATSALAVDEHFIDSKAVVGGYDVVAYHTVGKPTKGSANYSASYQGATWHFASRDNLDLFKAEPAKYAPAYGGWCSAGASKGKKVPTKPDLWAIVDGQLYLNSSPAAHNKLFLADTEGVIRKGEANWKRIFATPRGEL
ncbi:MAG: YHS domain-containing (seleno)protein [Gammaproteobacteria bacterium]|nr:YHS domain-containing (seleno)protein [Gammaproteobacteria bacterium]